MAIHAGAPILIQRFKVAEIFFYLLEHYSGIQQCPDAVTLARRLAYQGFEETDVRAAIAWVELLRQPLNIEVLHAVEADSHRIYHSAERLHVGDENLLYLNSLVHSGSISNAQSERILERCMLLPSTPQQLEYFKALVLTILWADNQSIEETLLQTMLGDDDFGACH